MHKKEEKMKNLYPIFWEIFWGLFWVVIPTSIGYCIKIKKKHKKMKYNVMKELLADLKKADEIEELFKQKELIFSVLLKMSTIYSDFFNKNENQKIQNYQALLIEREINFDSLKLIRLALVELIIRKINR